MRFRQGKRNRSRVQGSEVQGSTAIRQYFQIIRFLCLLHSKLTNSRWGGIQTCLCRSYDRQAFGEHWISGCWTFQPLNLEPLNPWTVTNFYMCFWLIFNRLVYVNISFWIIPILTQNNHNKPIIIVLTGWKPEKSESGWIQSLGRLVWPACSTQAPSFMAGSRGAIQKYLSFLPGCEALPPGRTPAF